MPTHRSYEADPLIGPAYLLAALLVATPALDFLSGIQPITMSNIQWRFGAVGLMSGFLLTPLLGIAIAMGTAQYADHGIVQRILAILNLTIAGLFLAILVAFVLDILQLNSAVEAESAGQFRSAAWKALVKHLAFIVVIGWMGVAGYRISARTMKATRDRAAGPASVIVGA
ncbi:MAG: hypothetical protein ACT4OZ_08840 [Gemmatimonadota bacterium]